MTPELIAFGLFALALILCLAYDNRKHHEVWRDE